VGLENVEEANLTKIYCKHFGRCHDASPGQQYDDKNKIKIKENLPKSNKQAKVLVYVEILGMYFPE
jgi:hypothetical protein